MSIQIDVEDRTYDKLLTEVLALVRSDVDKREGSVIFDAVSPAMMIVAEVYDHLAQVIQAVDIEYAEGEDLDRLVKLVDIQRKLATPATLCVRLWESVIDNADNEQMLPLDTEPGQVIMSVGDDGILYDITEQIGMGLEGVVEEYVGTEGRNPGNAGKWCFRKSENETVWEIPQEGKVAYFTDGTMNAIQWVESTAVPEGALLVPWVMDLGYLIVSQDTGEMGNVQNEFVPVEGIDGLAEIEYVGTHITAIDDEDDETLRQRYYNVLRKSTFTGNRESYRVWLADWRGDQGETLGAVQIYGHYSPVSVGSVKVVITNSMNRVPTVEPQQLLDKVSQALDPYKDAQGRGVVPIGHIVATGYPTEVLIDIAISKNDVITLDGDAALITEKLTGLFETKRINWGVENENSQYSLSITANEIRLALIAIRQDLIGFGITLTRTDTLESSTEGLVLTETAALQELPMLGKVTLDGVVI